MAAALSAGTAAVSIFTFARSYGLIGAPAPAALTVGSVGVSWVGLSPAVDTARALGDTIRLAATVTDTNGTALIGATIHWSSDEPNVVQVLGGGRLLARRPGTATIVAAVGEKLARAKVVVYQRVAAVRADGDSVPTIGEDDHRRLALRVTDANGKSIARRNVAWRSLDTSVVTIDSTGVATGRVQGTALIGVDVEGVTAQLPVRVVPLPQALDVIAGTEQRAFAGATLGEPVTVRLVSTRGRPIAGEPVHFRAAAERATVDPSTTVTDAQGRARVMWTLGPLPGRQRLVAWHDRLDSAAVVIAEADPVAANTRVSSLRDGLAGAAGAPLADTLGVRVADSSGRALPDIPIVWSADDRGAIAALAERTDSLGEARAVWTLGPRAGTQKARVRVGSGRAIPTLVLKAHASAGAPTAVTVVSGDGQHGRVGAPLPKPVLVHVADAAGNPVPGAQLELRAGPGELGDSVVTTDSSGRARIVWTMPRSVGARRLTVRVPELARPLAVTATAMPAAAANVAFTEPAGPAVPGKPLGRWIEATVTDVYGNAIPGAVVSFSARAGRTAPLKVATDADGVARTKWTLGSKPGDQTLTASVPQAPRGELTVTVEASKTAKASRVTKPSKPSKATKRVATR